MCLLFLIQFILSVYIEMPLYLQNKINLIIVCNLFSLLLNSVFKHFIEHFYAHVHQGNLSIVFLFKCILIGFWYHTVVVCKE